MKGGGLFPRERAPFSMELMDCVRDRAEGQR
jgi:hypothetical protein